MFFTSIAPAITFAELLATTTEKIGVVEVCLSSCLSGMVFSVFAGQPLVIVGVTGPVTILTISIYGMAKALDISFLHFYAWAQIWAGLMHMAAAAAGLCDYIRYITNFSCHTFGMLIAVIYAVTGAVGIAKYYTRSQSFAACLMETILALGTTLLSLYLANASNWVIGNEKFRTFVSDYAPTVAIVIWTGISLVGRADDLGSDLTRLNVPRNFQTIGGRTWFLNLFDFPVWGIVLSLVPASIILILFIFDHNVSSIMAQSKEFQLKKGSAYHLDFFVLGICIVFTGILGIPPCNGLIPQAPLHTKSLCVVRKEKQHGVVVGVVGGRTSSGTRTSPRRADGRRVLPAAHRRAGPDPQGLPRRALPLHGAELAAGNELWRFCLVIAEPALRKSPHAWFRALDFATIKSFTKLQLAIAFVIYFVTLTPISMTFPLFIAALVYVRLKVLPKYFDEATLLALDPLIELAPDDPDGAKKDDFNGAAELVEDPRRRGRGQGGRRRRHAGERPSSNLPRPREPGSLGSLILSSRRLGPPPLPGSGSRARAARTSASSRRREAVVDLALEAVDLGGVARLEVAQVGLVDRG
ncbi:inorganic anion exchanger [Aureococcus anophagefferens]|nr:inorganic anion exchanger [Aureococcus anophagefferens]